MISVIDHKVYVGRTDKDPKSRIEEHNHNKNKWSKDKGPFKLVYYEKFHCKQDSIEREMFYKSGFGREIKELIVKRYLEKFGE